MGGEEFSNDVFDGIPIWDNLHEREVVAEIIEEKNLHVHFLDNIYEVRHQKQTR